MNKFYHSFSKGLLALVAILMVFAGQAQEYPSLTITSGDIIMEQTDQVTPIAEFRDSIGDLVTVKIKWHTEPGYLGKVSKDGNLIPNHAGEGFLIAKYGELRDTVNLKVNGTLKGNDDDDEYPKVKIIPGSIKVEIGDSVELNAFYIDTSGVKIDTFFSWSVEPPELGEFPVDTVSIFYTGEIGNGMIIATLGELADTIKLRVIENKEKPNNGNNGNNGKQMTIIPGDTVVYIGTSSMQYSATYKTNGNKHQNAEMIWSISDEEIATIDSFGLVTLTGETGMVLISATYSNFRASTELLVIDSTIDLNVNTISVHRVLPNGNELKAKTFKEGESYKIGGLPFPLNMLNGGMIHFPFGCIDEDIKIYMFIPEVYANINGDSINVLLDEGIINGVEFHVKPVDSVEISENYYFNIPINLSLVYKRDLLDSLGISPDSLDVFFAENTGFIQADDKVAIDTARNRIYAKIEHFSTIVVRQKSFQTFINEFEKAEEEILSVYPNPFNTITKILFNVDEKSEISLAIYNLYGQKVKQLVNEERPMGKHTVFWNGNNEAGSSVTNGIYFFRIIVDGKEAQVKRIVLNR